MRLFRQLTLYMALALGANAAFAADTAALSELREGDMRRLILHSEAKPTSANSFELEDGKGSASLADYEGKIVLLNFWATWCAPCRKEMPMLSEL
ncbi:MAG: TlpA family protein disulfide reductase, partial [Phaeobacter italicus]